MGEMVDEGHEVEVSSFAALAVAAAQDGGTLVPISMLFRPI